MAANTSRAQMQDLWLAKVKQAQHNFHEAAAKRREAQQSLISGTDGNYGLTRATRAEDAARHAYAKVLKVFGNLVIKGEFSPRE